MSVKMVDDDPDWRVTPEEYKQILIDKTKERLKENKEMAKENVNHPKHYNREGGMECIDEMILVFGKEAVQNFCLCNAWKYRYRAADKNGEEDLKKSDWYLNKYEELKRGPSHTVIESPNIITIPAANTDAPWYIDGSTPVIYATYSTMGELN